MLKTNGAHPQSYYVATAKGLNNNSRLEGDAHADVCVIGAGYTGLSTALHLAERGYSVVVLEAKRIGWGASGRNGGQINSGQRNDQNTLEAKYGKTTAHLLWDLAEEAKNLTRSLIQTHTIDCDIKPGILHVAHKPHHASWCRSYAEKLNRDYNYDQIEALDRAQLTAHIGSDIYHGGYLDMGGFHIHPLNYALGLAAAAKEKGVQIFERTRARRIENGAHTTLHTMTGHVIADHIVVACNGYLDNLTPQISGHIMPIHNYMIATEPLGEDMALALIPNDVAVADTKFVINYFRLSKDKRLLFGGGESYRRNFKADIEKFVSPHMLHVFPHLKDIRIEYSWGGTLAITTNRMPHIGKLTPNMYFAQGYSGHGIAMATMAGKLIAEAVSGTMERFDIFASLPPSRFPGGTLLRTPGFMLGMLYYALRDRL